MADSVMGIVAESLFKMALSLAMEQLSLVLGVKEQLNQLAEKLKMIQSILSAVQTKPRAANTAINDWLKKLQFISLDAQIVLDEFGYQILRQNIETNTDKVRCSIPCSDTVSFRTEIAHKIKDVLSSLEEHYKKANQIGLAMQLIDSVPNYQPKEERLTNPYVDDSEIVGRDADVSKVIRMLTSSQYEMELPVITILGMGGQGKTTVAQLVYKSDPIKSYFHKTIWVCVSDDFDIKRILGEMLQSLTKINHHLTSPEALVNSLKEELKDENYLLVLDDVWNDNEQLWGCLRTCLLQIEGSKKESKILATTRSENVVSTMKTPTSGLHRLDMLSENQSWELFEKYAFAEGGIRRLPKLADIGEKILKRCRGVPLAIKTIGGLLCQSFELHHWSMIEKSAMWHTFNEGDRVLSTIKLSYDHLPSLSIKQCFAYCTIFEKDTILEKDKLIQLWMALGLLNPPTGLEMEDTGNNYFNILLRNSLFQDAQKDSDNKITTCKMHSLVHDFSSQVSESCCFHIKDWQAIKNEIEAVHILINSSEWETWENSSEKGMWKSLKGFLPSNVRTLHLKGLGLPKDMFPKFRCLSVLIVKHWVLKKLPDEIGVMKCLRFLDISCTRIERLPKSLTKLYYLQTLRVNQLKEMPKGIWNLINLRHIHMNKNSDGCHEFLFPALGQLKNLRTYQIEDLEYEDSYRGTLKILHLQNVGSREFAAKFNLSNIHTLALHWNEERKESCDDYDVIEGLKPHPNLESLTIYGYRSPRFPSWMVTQNDLPIRNLVNLSLWKLDKCERLPPLGKLLCLEYLEIGALDNVKCIEKEFYGCSYLEPAARFHNWQTELEIFPALKKLKITMMKSVVEWSDPTEIIPVEHSSSVQVKVFPCLTEIDISWFPQLTHFPNFGSLPNLQVWSVKNCENLTISWGGGNRGVYPLKFDNYFQSLHHLYIHNCDKLSAVVCSFISGLAPLESLYIEGNPNSWPKDLHHLSNLKELRLLTQRDCQELDCLPWPYPTKIVYLTSLVLDGCQTPKVKSLPHQLQYVTTLRELGLWHFDGLEALPEWLGGLEHLHKLDIWRCKNLKHLPSVQALQRLTSLKHLTVEECPLLKIKREVAGKTNHV